MKSFLEEAARVKPNPRQLAWYDLGFYAFIHFGVNTFTDREWGIGGEPEGLFDPTELDCDQWVEAIKSAGMKGMVLTCKHHDGFCLWPSAYTEHSVKNSPCKRDVVKEAAEACRRGGIRFGIYLSPWDRSSELYGTDAYNDYFCNQLTELLTNYGEIFHVWFDLACGEGPNGKKQEYDFPRYIELIRKYQPNATIFNDFGPDVRWCGNEAGTARHAEWAVVPKELCFRSEVQTGAGPLADEGSLEYLYNTGSDIGCLHNIMYSKGLVFAPSEVNMSIRPGWFWHEKEEPHSLERLFRTYLTSVGGNACFNLNLPPDRRGKIDERDVRRLKELGELLQKEFGSEIPATVRQLESPYPTQAVFEMEFDRVRDDIRYIELREDIAQGQRVESFQIETEDGDGGRLPFYQGTTIGNRRICELKDPFADQNPLTRTFSFEAKKLVIRITSARGEVRMKSIKAY
ncbi:MAG TPA: alpha-L-fucosidase [Candidatus Eisenbergiella merdigallinarum]|uniref:alpha-L-fucosidase n=1 Tax=Candidatus Eisenbergiella merdigallinarum TaxID=2838552 RepID=A0A9D2MST7_9FIRM|nr:alpha-L-fucosidase [Candidatus Eisenbergiella merdigallinarum]